MDEKTQFTLTIMGILYQGQSNMAEEIVTSCETEFAPAERLGYPGLMRQHQAWAAQMQTKLISNAVPDLLVILNKYRQIVFANDQILKWGNYSDPKEYLGLRPGELMGCIHATETPGGCGTSRFCSKCGAAEAILLSLTGKSVVEECRIERSKDFPLLNLRVWTTPVELNEEKYVIFALHDISLEKENAQLLEQVQKLAIIDPLIEIFNRRFFFDVANREIVRSMRYHNPFSVIMIDLDKFKQINDTYGHPAGDAVLKEIVRLIKQNLREIDTLARYGGDEFIILLPETGLVGGQKVADRIMKAGDEACYLFKDFEIPIAFSAGVAEFTFDLDHDIDDVIGRADKELYLVKENRRRGKIE